MHEHAPTLLPHILKVIKHVIQDAGDVLRGAVLQPKRAVDEVRLEVLGADESHAVEYVGDPVLAKDVTVLGDGITSEVDMVGDLGALLVEESDLVLAALRAERGEVQPEALPGLGGGRAAVHLGGTGRGGVGPLPDVVGASLGPLVEAAAGDGERLQRREAGPGLGAHRPRGERRRRRDAADVPSGAPRRRGPILRRLGGRPRRGPRRGAPELAASPGRRRAVVGGGHGHESQPRTCDAAGKRTKRAGRLSHSELPKNPKKSRGGNSNLIRPRRAPCSNLGRAQPSAANRGARGRPDREIEARGEAGEHTTRARRPLERKEGVGGKRAKRRGTEGGGSGGTSG